MGSRRSSQMLETTTASSGVTKVLGGGEDDTTDLHVDGSGDQLRTAVGRGGGLRGELSILTTDRRGW